MGFRPLGGGSTESRPTLGRPSKMEGSDLKLKRTQSFVGVTWLAMFLVVFAAEAQFLTVSFSDSVGDHLGATDLSRLDFTFDVSSGEYQVVLTATLENPFIERFVVGVNLFNADSGSTALNPSFFHADSETFALGCPVVAYSITGIDPRLQQWKEGDRVAASGPDALGLPDGFSVFSSGLASLSDTTRADDEVGAGEVGILSEASGFQKVSNPPVVEDDFFEVLEDSDYSEFDILGNDCSSSVDGFGVSLVDLTVNEIRGEISLLGDVVRYRPPADFFGEEQFEYSVVDSAGLHSSGLVTIKVLSVNDPPVALDDAFELDGNLPLHRLDVLANDHLGPEPEETLTIVSWEADPRLSSISLQDSIFVYESDGEFGGEALIRYTVSDGSGGTASAVATVVVVLANRDPTALSDSVFVLEDTPVVIDVLGNDTSAPDHGETLSLESISESRVGAELAIVDARVRYVPPPDFYGADAFSYTISDGRGGSAQATVSVTVENVNDSPSARDDFFQLDEGGKEQFVLPLENDSSAPDPFEVLRIRRVHYAGESAALAIVGNQVSVTTTESFQGAFQFTYVVADEAGSESEATVTVNIQDFNSPPTATLDRVSVAGDTSPIVIDVLANDSSDPDVGETLSIASVENVALLGSEITHDANQVTVLPPRGFDGGWFRYSVSDGNGGLDRALVVLTVIETSDVPAANNDFISIEEDQSIVLDVRENDLVGPEWVESTVTLIDEQPVFGEAKLAANGQLRYQPALNFVGQDSFKYSLSYPNGEQSSARVTIDVTNVNDPPHVVSDRFTVFEDASDIRLDLLANDSSLPDPPEQLTLVSVGEAASGGILRVVDDAVLYRPRENFYGVDRFSYLVRDEGGAESRGEVEVFVVSVNDQPMARDDEVTVEEGATHVFLDLLANDSIEPDGDETLRLLTVSQGSKGGSVLMSATGVFYSPPRAFVELDRFEYAVTDGNGGVSQATVTVSIGRTDRSPTARADLFEIFEDSERIELDVLQNDQSGSVSENAMNVELAKPFDGEGDLILESNRFWYQPPSNFAGRETFIYQVFEGDRMSDAVSVTILVHPVNDPPVVADDFFRLVDPDESIRLDVLANDSTGVDRDEELSLSSVELGSAGSLTSLLDGHIDYQPDASFSGVEVFSYTVSDGNGGQGTASVRVEIIRKDRMPPAVRCRDLTLRLPTTQVLALDVAAIDDSSWDNSGELALSVSPRRFGIEDLGVNTVTLRGVDEAGNVAECEALLTLLPPAGLNLELIEPKPSTVLAVWEDYGFTAADVPIQVGVEGLIDTLEFFGDGRKIHEVVVDSGVNSVAWIWEEVFAGDHVIEVVGYQGAQVVASVKARFSVSELASEIAFVTSDDGSEGIVGRVRDYVFELGGNLQVFSEPLPEDFSNRAWDLVIWHGAPPRGGEGERLGMLERLERDGVGLYFLGAASVSLGELSNAERESWAQITLFSGDRVDGLSGDIDLDFEANDPFVRGRFGSLSAFSVTELEGGSLANPDAVPVLGLDGWALAASLEGPGRRYVQLIPLANVEHGAELKSLFQNAVCWLLPTCSDCQNASLPPVIEKVSSSVVAGQDFSVLLSLENNGACEVTGADVRLSAEDVVVQRVLLDGLELQPAYDSVADQWFVRLGRVGKGSVATRSLEWTLALDGARTRELLFETQSNNTENESVAVSIDVLSAEVIKEGSETLWLRVFGTQGQRVEVESTRSLYQETGWRSLRRVTIGASGFSDVPLSLNEEQQFFRLLSVSD